MSKMNQLVHCMLILQCKRTALHISKDDTHAFLPNQLKKWSLRFTLNQMLLQVDNLQNSFEQVSMNVC